MARWQISRHSKLKANQTIHVNYADAKKINTDELVFPLAFKKPTPIYKEVTDSIGIDYTHQEKDIIDYNVQRTLPHKLTQNGPCLVAGDLNGDGTEDFIVGSASGYSPEVFLQKKDGAFTSSPFSMVKSTKNMKKRDWRSSI